MVYLVPPPELPAIVAFAGFDRRYDLTAFADNSSSPIKGAKTSGLSKVAQTPTQSDPNRDRFLQPAPAPLPAPPSDNPVSPTPTPAPPAAPSIKIPIRKIEVTGSTVFESSEIKAIVERFEGRSLTLEELRSVADAITQLYLNNGYITSRAILGDQKITDGVVQIQIIEGSLQQIDIAGTERLNPAYIRSRIQLGAKTPLNTGQLEEQLRLLRLDPLLENVEASLRSGSQFGQSILTVRVTEANPFEINLGIDNYSPPSIGSERIGVNLRHRNLTGLGDEVAGSYYFSLQGGSDIFDFTYRVPLNPMNGTLQLRAAPNRSEIVQPPLDVFGFGGKQDVYEISYRQPLVRSVREEFALSLGFTLEDGQTFVSENIPLLDLDSRTRVIKFGQDYTRRDPQGAWSGRSQFSLGTGWFDATVKSDPNPDGRFFSWLGQLQRVQLLAKDHLLIVQADIQLTPNSLLPSQLFVIGGGQSVRGYRQNVRAGDNGFRFSIEDRITVQRNEGGSPILQVAPFIDLGAVWNVSDNPNNDFLPQQRFLAGAGLGLLWEPLPRLNVRLDYTPLFINLSDRGDNIQDDGFYFSVNYQP